MVETNDRLLWAEGIRFAQIDNGLLIFDPQRKSYWTLREPATITIWMMCDGNHSANDIIKEICQRFNVDNEAAQTSCFDFIEQLINRKFIVTSNKTREEMDGKGDALSTNIRKLLESHYNIENIISMVRQDPVPNVSRKYRIKTPQSEYMLREYDPIYDEPQIQFEHSVLRHLAESGLGIEIQKPIRSRESNKTYFTFFVNDRDRFYTLFEFIPGQPWRWDAKNPELDIVHNLARVIAKMQLRLRGFAPEGKRHTLVEDLRIWITNLDNFPSDLDGDFAYRFSRVYPYFDEKGEALLALFQNQKCDTIAHTDIRPRNIILNADGEISGLIDFDKCSLFARSYDVATSLGALSVSSYDSLGNYEFDDKIANAYLDAYQRACTDFGIDALSEEEIRLIVPCIQLNILRGVNFAIISNAQLVQKLKVMEALLKQMEFFESIRKRVEKII